MKASPAHSEEEDGSERRAFFRVLTRIAIQCRGVSPSEAEALAREIPERRAPQPARLDESLAEWLDRIERKLDRILVHLGIGDPVVFTENDVQEVMLSGAGLSFVAAEPLERGRLLRVEFELPGVPARVVRCLARVVSHVPAKAEGEPDATAVAFEVIHEGDREAIVQHAVEVQRSLIRARHQGGAAR